MTRLFGTNGIRWVVGERSSDFSVRMGVAAGNFFGAGRRLGLGIDTRTSSEMVFNGVASGIMSAGCSIMTLGIVPTPLVQYAVREMKLDGGVMVTASHNPPEFNGLKFFAPDGTELSRADEEKVECLFSDGNLTGVGWDRIGKLHSDNHVQAMYKGSIVARMSLGKKKVKAVIDCANGTATEYTPDILSKAGCAVATINSQQDGRFLGRMPEPVMENLGHLMSTVALQGADLGVAHDGDSDRATFVDEKGEFITGDQSLAIFTADAIRRIGVGTIVVPINTSKMVEEVAVSAGGNVEYTAVGSPIIARRMMVNHAVFGGEGNGGAIFPEHQFCRDGVMAAARMAEIVSRGTPLSEIVAELPRYCIRSGKLKVPQAMKDRILEIVRKNAEGDIDEIDGVKSTFDDHWVLVRASGTEPIIRITVESRDRGKCESILADQTKALEEIIRSLS